VRLHCRVEESHSYARMPLHAYASRAYAPACVCAYMYASTCAYHPREQSSARYCVYMHIYIYIYIYIFYIYCIYTHKYVYMYVCVCVRVCILGVSLRTLPCTLTRRRFPIFRPKLSTEKPRPSDPPAPSDRANPLESPFPLLSPCRGPLTRDDGLSPSCATSSRHIRPESNVSRLNGFVSAVRFPPLMPPRIPLRASAAVRSSRRRGRNIYYKPRLPSASTSSPSPSPACENKCAGCAVPPLPVILSRVFSRAHIFYDTKEDRG